MKARRIAAIRCNGAVNVRGQVTTSVDCTKHGVQMYLRPYGVEILDPNSTMPYKDGFIPFVHIEQAWYDPTDKQPDEKEPSDKK